VRVPGRDFRKRRYILDQILVYGLNGWGGFHTHGKWVCIAAGDLLLIPTGTPTMLQVGPREPLSFRFIRLDYDWAGDYETRPVNSLTTEARRYPWHTPAALRELTLPRKINLRDDPRVPLLFDRVIREAEEKARGWELMVRAALMQLLAIVHRRARMEGASRLAAVVSGTGAARARVHGDKRRPAVDARRDREGGAPEQTAFLPRVSPNRWGSAAALSDAAAACVWR